MAKDPEYVKADDAPEGKFSLAEAIRRRFTPFGGVDLERAPPEIADEPPETIRSHIDSAG